MNNKQKIIYVDMDRCMNCRACEIACKLEHNLPVGPKYIEVIETEVSKDNKDRCEFLPLSCMHCGNPPCAKICPANAISKRLEDGVVVVDQGKCIGCRVCLWACPFGVPQFGFQGKMEKCNLCLHCLREGEIPACARACCGEAISVGTVEEIANFVREKYAHSSLKKLTHNRDVYFD
jgi:Fe-S-cluster-containing dehydrogenase component